MHGCHSSLVTTKTRHQRVMGRDPFASEGVGTSRSGSYVLLAKEKELGAGVTAVVRQNDHTKRQSAGQSERYPTPASGSAVANRWPDCTESRAARILFEGLRNEPTAPVPTAGRPPQWRTDAPPESLLLTAQRLGRRRALEKKDKIGPIGIKVRSSRPPPLGKAMKGGPRARNGVIRASSRALVHRGRITGRTHDRPGDPGHWGPSQDSGDSCVGTVAATISMGSATAGPAVREARASLYLSSGHAAIHSCLISRRSWVQVPPLSARRSK